VSDTKDREPPPAPNSVDEQEIVARVTAAFETGDADELLVLLTENVLVTMPPIPGECEGREDAGRYFRKTLFRPGPSMRIVPTRANRQPALASYVRDPQTDLYHASGIAVLTLSWASHLGDDDIRQGRLAIFWASAGLVFVTTRDDPVDS